MLEFKIDLNSLFFIVINKSSSDSKQSKLLSKINVVFRSADGTQPSVDIQLNVCAFQDITRQSERCIVTNPPYGIRIGSADSTIILYNELGEMVDRVTIEPLTPNSSYAQTGTEFIKTFALTPNLPNVDLPELPCNSGYIFSQITGTCQKIIATSDIPDEEVACAVGYEIGYTGTCVKVCAIGYERSPETNRCRKIVSELEATLAPCPIGYYRNPETNRCRKITITTQAGLSPCPIGYERSPETNRCRKISNQQDCNDGYEIGFTGSCVKKCDDGYERSPETNRCRKLIVQASETDVAGAFTIDDSVTNATPIVTLRWWQIGLGIGVLVSIGLFYKREAVIEWLRRFKK